MNYYEYTFYMVGIVVTASATLLATGFALGAVLGFFWTKAKDAWGFANLMWAWHRYNGVAVEQVAAQDAISALRELEPYIDSIICYASTMDEYEGNRIAARVKDLLARIDSERKT